MDSWAHQHLRGREWRLSMSIKVPGEPGEDAVMRTKWISQAPGRKQVAHRRKVTEEVNEGTVFKGMSRVKRTKI